MKISWRSDFITPSSRWNNVYQRQIIFYKHNLGTTLILNHVPRGEILSGKSQSRAWVIILFKSVSACALRVCFMIVSSGNVAFVAFKSNQVLRIDLMFVKSCCVIWLLQIVKYWNKGIIRLTKILIVQWPKDVAEWHADENFTAV
jgi:hypothetical protein